MENFGHSDGDPHIADDAESLRSKDRANHSPERVEELKKEMADLRPRLRAIAVNLCRDRTRAEDLVQQTYVKALGNLDLFTYGALAPWMVKMLHHVYYNEIRGEKVRARYADNERITVATNGEPSQLTSMQTAKVLAAMREIPPEQREALELYLQEYTYEEIAQALNIPEGTVKSRVNRARRAIADLLGEPLVQGRGDASLEQVESKLQPLLVGDNFVRPYNKAVIDVSEFDIPRQRLDAFLNTLPKAQQYIVRLVLDKGYTLTKLAQVARVNKTFIGYLLTDARKRLREFDTA